MSTTSRWGRLTDFPEPRLARVPPIVWALVWLAGLLLTGWNAYTGSDAYQESHGAANLAHPTAMDCGVARAIVADTHGTGMDRQFLHVFGDAKLSLQTFAWAWDTPSTPPAGYRATGADGDWRWCAGLGAYVRSVGWITLGEVLRQQSAINISMPAYNAARDEAVAYVDAMPGPRSADGWVGRDRRGAIDGNLVFLKQDRRTGAWTIAGRGPAS